MGPWLRGFGHELADRIDQFTDGAVVSAHAAVEVIQLVSQLLMVDQYLS